MSKKFTRLFPTPTQDNSSNRKVKYKQGGTPLTVAINVYPKWTSSPVDSHAKMSALLAKVKASRKVHDPVFGLSSTDLLGSYDPGTSSWRTSQLSFFEGLVRFSETFPKSGTMRNGKLYLRKPLVRRTSEKESLLWRTPQAGDGSHGGPNARDSAGGLHLSAQVQRWPTPRKAMTGAATRSRLSDKGRNLEKVVAQQGCRGQLNPMWVEWLMGFPLGWTVLNASETPSSRKSQSLSEGVS